MDSREQRAPLLEAWAYTVETSRPVVVFPDGCRDLIVRSPNAGPPTLLVSPLDHHARWVNVVAGERIEGLRLRPGVRVDEATLIRRWVDGDLADPRDLERELGTFVSLDPHVADALEALAEPHRLPQRAATSLGVSLRSLQRLLAHARLPSPQTWQQLARARRTAAALERDEPLASLALEHGYADQAHMTRAMRRWFGLGPRALRRAPDHRAAIAASGYPAP